MSCASGGMAVLNLLVKRNGVLRPIFTFTDYDGDPLDLTGWSAEMQVRAYPGAASALFTLTATPNANDSFIEVSDPLSGGVSAFISNDDITLVPEATDVSESVSYSYDVVLTDTAGDFLPFVGGSFTVIPGVTA